MLPPHIAVGLRQPNARKAHLNGHKIELVLLPLTRESADKDSRELNMTLRIARNAGLLSMVVAMTISAAALNEAMQRGKDYYFAAEFKKAISQFELVTKENPDDPQAYLWLGKSYTMLADLKPLFGTRTRVKAWMYLAKAVNLAPECDECRRELFDSLITSDDSPSAWRDAKLLVANMSKSDPDYPSMHAMVEKMQNERHSVELLTVTLFSLPSQTISRLSVHPITQPSSVRREVKLSQGAASGEKNKQTLVSLRGE